MDGSIGFIGEVVNRCDLPLTIQARRDPLMPDEIYQNEAIGPEKHQTRQPYEQEYRPVWIPNRFHYPIVTPFSYLACISS